MKRILVAGLGLAVVFQLVILVGIYVSAAMPLWTGQEIHMRTIPVDPRSLFRGNYAQLAYDISRIQSTDLPEDDSLRNGEVVYVRLAPDEDGLYVYAGASLDRPDSGVFIRGRIANRRYEEQGQFFRINYGIEAFFAPKVKALALESDLRDGGVAVLMVATDGRARIKAVQGEPGSG